MVLKIIILALAALGLIFVVGPFFNYAVFDFQCGPTDYCGPSCVPRKIYSSIRTTGTCELEDIKYDGCLRNCQVRNFKCGFDEEIKNKCIKCVQDCEAQYAFSKAVAEAKEACFNACYNPSSENNSS